MSVPTALCLEGRVVDVIFTIRKHLLFPKLMLVESEVYIRWGDVGGDILGRSSGRTKGGCREPPGMCLHLGSEGLESRWAAVESHAAVLSVLSVWLLSIKRGQTCFPE